MIETSTFSRCIYTNPRINIRISFFDHRSPKTFEKAPPMAAVENEFERAKGTRQPV
jgi:hypothetical protein